MGLIQFGWSQSEQEIAKKMVADAEIKMRILDFEGAELRLTTRF